MYLKRRQAVLNRFLRVRSNIIKKYDSDLIDKREFLEKNYNLINRTGITPFTIVDSFEKGMYNYQYYNTLAKYNKNLANEARIRGNHKRDINKYMNKCDYYYKMKDKTSLELIEHLKYKNIDAYMIETESPALKGKLYEIVLWDFKEAIFHSTSAWLLGELKKAGIFKAGYHPSLISGYINEKY